MSGGPSDPGAPPPPDGERLHAPAALRNRDPILAVLRRVLEPNATVLEIASGTGLHVSHFARHMPEIRWRPSDPDPAMRRSIAAWSTGLSNVDAAVGIDVLEPGWNERVVPPVDAIISINMLHVAPIDAIAGLIDGAAGLLVPGQPLLLYGPFRFNDDYIGGDGNRRFDRMLQQQNPAWGLRDLNDIAVSASGRFVVERVIDMPAANHILLLRRS